MCILMFFFCGMNLSLHFEQQKREWREKSKGGKKKWLREQEKSRLENPSRNTRLSHGCQERLDDLILVALGGDVMFA